MKALKIIPLGGLGEVGMNSMYIEYDQSSFIFDCGAMSSHYQWLGFDFIIPDFDKLLSQGYCTDTLVISHAHEDHIGAIYFLLESFPINKIYCSSLCFEVLKQKLNNNFLNSIEFIIIKENKTYKDKDFEFTYIPSTHSIAESFMININTPIGSIFHTGDFKIDTSTVVGDNFSFEALKQFKKPLILMSDSTNSEKEGVSGSESAVKNDIKEIVNDTERNTFVSFFASNTHRMKTILDIASETKKTVAIMGGSMWKFLELTRKLSILSFYNLKIIDVNEMSEEESYIVLCTGSQGEYNTGLARLLRGEYPNINLGPKDSCILSALKIPGNELNIRYLINAISFSGCNLYHGDKYKVHVSGHAYKEEQIQLAKFLDPKFFIPVHGDFYMMKNHIESLSSNLNVDCLLAMNGDVVEVTPTSICKVAKLDVVKHWTRGKNRSGVDDIGVKTRKRIARNGLVILKTYYESKKLFSPIYLDFIGYEIDPEIINDAKRKIEKEMLKENYDLESCRSLVARVLKKLIGWKPEVIVYLN